MMGNDTDPASAARRVAAKLAPHRGKDLTGQCLILDGADDLRTLLPFLDTVAAGPDADRLERWARAMCRAAGHTNPDQPYAHGKLWEKWASSARAAIALADAEAAAKREAGWKAYEEALETYDDAAREVGRMGYRVGPEYDTARTALDAAVRALAGR